MAKAKKLKIQLIRGLAGKKEYEKQVLAGLGLHKINQVREHEETPVIMGMVGRVKHMVKVLDK